MIILNFGWKISYRQKEKYDCNGIVNEASSFPYSWELNESFGRLNGDRFEVIDFP